MTSKLRNYISSPTSFVNSANRGYCHLLVENLKSNFVDNTLCSREWIFLSSCDNDVAVLSRRVQGKADNLLGYCSNRLLTPEDKRRLISSVQVPPQVSRPYDRLHILNFSSGGIVRDFLVNYQTELFKLLRPFHSWACGALLLYCQVKLRELLRAPPDELLCF